MKIADFEKLFSYYRDSVIVIKDGKIIYKNPSADEFLPEASVGSETGSVLPGLIFPEDERSFTASVPIKGQPCLVIASDTGKETVLTISRTKSSEDGTNAFFHSISNEINSASAVIQLTTELLQPLIEGSGDKKNERYYAILLHNAYKTARIAANLALLGSPAENMVKIASAFDLADLCGDLAATTDHLVNNQKKTVLFKSAVGTLPFAGDKEKIQTLILNLLSNAVKYTPEGGKIELILRKTADGAVITVKDNGIGISPEKMPSAFGRHLEVRDLSDIKSGCGIGLPIVDLIAKLHGGSVMIQSTPKTGTSVTVSLKSEELSKFNNATSNYESSGMTNIYLGIADAISSDAFLPKYQD